MRTPTNTMLWSTSQLIMLQWYQPNWAQCYHLQLMIGYHPRTNHSWSPKILNTLIALLSDDSSAQTSSEWNILSVAQSTVSFRNILHLKYKSDRFWIGFSLISDILWLSVNYYTCKLNILTCQIRVFVWVAFSADCQQTQGLNNSPGIRCIAMRDGKGDAGHLHPTAIKIVSMKY